MRPICVGCRKEMAVKRNEVVVKDKAVGGFPSTYHYGDLYECSNCGLQIITGFGKAVPAEALSSFERDTSIEIEH